MELLGVVVFTIIRFVVIIVIPDFLLGEWRNDPNLDSDLKVLRSSAYLQGLLAYLGIGLLTLGDRLLLGLPLVPRLIYDSRLLGLYFNVSYPALTFLADVVGILESHDLPSPEYSIVERYRVQQTLMCVSQLVAAFFFFSAAGLGRRYPDGFDKIDRLKKTPVDVLTILLGFLLLHSSISLAARTSYFAGGMDIGFGEQHSENGNDFVQILFLKLKTTKEFLFEQQGVQIGLALMLFAVLVRGSLGNDTMSKSFLLTNVVGFVFVLVAFFSDSAPGFSDAIADLASKGWVVGRPLQSNPEDWPSMMIQAFPGYHVFKLFFPASDDGGIEMLSNVSAHSWIGVVMAAAMGPFLAGSVYAFLLVGQWEARFGYKLDLFQLFETFAKVLVLQAFLAPPCNVSFSVTALWLQCSGTRPSPSKTELEAKIAEEEKSQKADPGQKSRKAALWWIRAAVRLRMAELVKEQHEALMGGIETYSTAAAGRNHDVHEKIDHALAMHACIVEATNDDSDAPDDNMGFGRAQDHLKYHLKEQQMAGWVHAGLLGVCFVCPFLWSALAFYPPWSAAGVVALCGYGMVRAGLLALQSDAEHLYGDKKKGTGESAHALNADNHRGSVKGIMPLMYHDLHLFLKLTDPDLSAKLRSSTRMSRFAKSIGIDSPENPVKPGSDDAAKTGALSTEPSPEGQQDRGSFFGIAHDLAQGAPGQIERAHVLKLVSSLEWRARWTHRLFWLQVAVGVLLGLTKAAFWLSFSFVMLWTALCQRLSLTLQTVERDAELIRAEIRKFFGAEMIGVMFLRMELLATLSPQQEKGEATGADKQNGTSPITDTEHGVSLTRIQQQPLLA